jgi:hypothetical protein
VGLEVLFALDYLVCPDILDILVLLDILFLDILEILVIPAD